MIKQFVSFIWQISSTFTNNKSRFPLDYSLNPWLRPTKSMTHSCSKHLTTTSMGSWHNILNSQWLIQFKCSTYWHGNTSTIFATLQQYLFHSSWSAPDSSIPYSAKSLLWSSSQSVFLSYCRLVQPKVISLTINQHRDPWRARHWPYQRHREQTVVWETKRILLPVVPIKTSASTLVRKHLPRGI